MYMQETIAEWLTAVEDEGKIKSNYEVLYTNSKLKVWRYIFTVT